MFRFLLILVAVLIALAAVAFGQDTTSAAPAPMTSTDSAYHQFVLDSIRLEHEAAIEKIEAARGHRIPAESVIGVMIPIIAIISVFLWLWRSNEAKKAVRLAMIEKGMDPSMLMEQPNENSRKYGALRFGMLLAGIGLGLLVGFVICESLHLWEQDYVPLIIISSTLLFGGGGLIAYHWLISKLEATSKS